MTMSILIMNRSRGFSLIELLVVLVVVAFLAFLTAPLATSWIRNAQLEKDFAGVQRALGAAKALAMRNSAGIAAADNTPAAAAFPAEAVTAALCRSGDDLFVAASPSADKPVSCAEDKWNRLPTGRPVYHMGQDVAITFGSTKNFCGALFDARGRVRLCEGTAPCTSCATSFDPATGLRLVITGADSFSDTTDSSKPDPKDQSNIIRAF